MDLSNHPNGDDTMTPDALRQILIAHAAWLRAEASGTRANLTDADLTDADLRGADLTRANLTRANLTRANLRGADLTDANLTDADLTDADLTDAELTDADLRGADLAALGVPAIPQIDAAILSAVDQPGASLYMRSWHRGTCQTAHCRAGWAIHLAGDAGYALEAKIGPSAAGALIYAASGSHPTPDWHTDNEAAMADLRERAARAAE